jgi:NAD(P)-dependent dehydrogenase (short-subunit alcohol dehydrogenase family)
LKSLRRDYSESMKTNNKVALITGANRGLGLQTARELGKVGITLLLGVRDVSKSQEALRELKGLGHSVEAMPLDVSDIYCHNYVYDQISEKYGKLDILVNNAGIWKETLNSSSNVPRSNNTSTVRLELLKEIFETNFFGTVHLTQFLLPLIRKSPAGRILNVSSILGSLTLQSDPESPIYQYKVFAYDTSKTALNSFTVHLAHELRDTPIKVNSAHPGWVRTEMGGEGADLDLSEGGKTSATLATLPDDGPTGGYFHLGQKLPW